MTYISKLHHVTAVERTDITCDTGIPILKPSAADVMVLFVNDEINVVFVVAHIIVLV